MLSELTSKIDTRYTWADIPSIGDMPGIYAWYYLPELTNFDLETTIGRVQKLVSAGQVIQAKELISDFLNQFIFQYFLEDPYVAVLRGPLKPSYEGQLSHKPNLSQTLVDRLVDDPERLLTVKDVLENSAPDFASPIYIGMSDSLGRRLKRHRQLIERYREQQASVIKSTSSRPSIGERDRRDQSFARQIANREFNPQRLFVMIREIDVCDNRYVDLENILNRIHYPLLGRN